MRRAVAVVLALVASACGAAPRTFTVAARVALSGEAPFTVTTTGSVDLEQDKTAKQEIVFESTQAVVLEDIRWTFSVVRGKHVFATAGYGCGPILDPKKGTVQFACTADYRFLTVAPGKPLRETITLYGGIDGRLLATGRSVFRQPITWWHSTGNPLDPRGAEGGRVIVTLTYDVRAR